MLQGYVCVSGTVKATNAGADQTVIAAQGAGKVIRVKQLVICVTTAATGGGGLVALEDGVGGTRFIEIDGNALGVYSINFGDEGYPLSSNTALNLTVDNAVTTQASATCTAVAIVGG